MLRVGKVKYLNTLPLFYSLEGFELVEGHPSELVSMIREGKIDAGIVSSVEYFFNPEDYLVLPDISISSAGKVCSVLLLSNKPIASIRKVRITPSSLTSKYLLRYLFKKVYHLELEEVEREEEAVLSIGDEAFKLKEKFPYAYDLGEEWFKSTGLPFVYALFLVRRNAPAEEVVKLHKQLKTSVKKFFYDLERGKAEVPEDFIAEYLSSCIDYGLSEAHLKSLKTFFSFMEEETGSPAPEIISLFHP
ncbi:MAG: menaquinone biosynthesis protein [Aquificae bacterium]|nr:menaquinone biosynthesis protein [Aquificota bacterium]